MTKMLKDRRFRKGAREPLFPSPIYNIDLFFSKWRLVKPYQVQEPHDEVVNAPGKVRERETISFKLHIVNLSWSGGHPSTHPLFYQHDVTRVVGEIHHQYN